VEKENIINRLKNIVALITSDQDFIIWTINDWNNWLLNLGVPQGPPPSNLIIKHRRALWGFIKLGHKGILSIIRRNIEIAIPLFIRNYEANRIDDMLIRQQAERYNDLKQLLIYIDKISIGTDYLENINNDIQMISDELENKLSKKFFNTL
jgi:hypothetical protein